MLTDGKYEYLASPSPASAWRHLRVAPYYQIVCFGADLKEIYVKATPKMFLLAMALFHMKTKQYLGGLARLKVSVFDKK